MTRVALVTNLATHYRTPLFERAAARFQADFYLTSKGEEWYWPPLAQLSTGALRPYTRPNGVHLAASLVRGKYDCIVTSLVGRTTLVATVLVAIVTRTPLVVWVGIWDHPRTFFHRLSRHAARWIYRHADVVLVYGSHVARFVEQESGRVDDVIELPQAVDNDTFRVRMEDDAVAAERVRFGMDGELFGCFVGRLAPGKGLETLIEALALTKSPQRLALVGHGSLQEPLEALAAEHGVSDRVVFTGYIPQQRLPRVLQAADYLILPSVTTPRFKECWGLVVNEAMNSRLPVIATDAVGAVAGGLVVDDVTGLVVPERDPASLAAAMDRMADSALRGRIAEEASRHVLGWSFDAGADALELAVHRAIARRRPDASSSRA